MKLTRLYDMRLGDGILHVIGMAVERVLPFDALDNVVLLRFTGHRPGSGVENVRVAGGRRLSQPQCDVGQNRCFSLYVLYGLGVLPCPSWIGLANGLGFILGDQRMPRG